MSALPAGRPNGADESAGDGSRPGLVDTGVALRVARRLAADPLAGSYLLQDVAGHFGRLVAEAEPMVAEEAGFGPSTPGRARVLSRSEWAELNIGSTVGLLKPLLEKVEARLPSHPAPPQRPPGDEQPPLRPLLGPLGSPAALTRKVYASALGAQLGGVLGFVSQRVLGQFDLNPMNAADVWFVAPNIVMMERRFGFVPRDFRLWVASHELTHRAQFEGNPWLRDYFFGLVHTLLSSMELQALPMAERALRALRVPTEKDPAPLGVRLLDPAQREVFERLQALMTVVEGHGNFVMDRVALDAIPTQPRMRRSLSGRSMDGPLARILRKVLGLEMKRLQYEEGQRFFESVQAAAGRDGVRAAFGSAGTLPSMEELRDPRRWLERISP